MPRKRSEFPNKFLDFPTLTVTLYHSNAYLMRQTATSRVTKMNKKLFSTALIAILAIGLASSATAMMHNGEMEEDEEEMPEDQQRQQMHQQMQEHQEHMQEHQQMMEEMMQEMEEMMDRMEEMMEEMEDEETEDDEMEEEQQQN